MTTPDDIGSALLTEDTVDGFSMSICIFDLYAGGLGFADKAYDHSLQIVDNAIRMVEGCQCSDGCSACVGDYHLDKRVILWGLKSIFEQLEAPKTVKTPQKAPGVTLKKRFQFRTLPEHWGEFVAFIGPTNEYLSKFLMTVSSVSKKESTLILHVENAFYKEWISDETNKENLKNLLKQAVSVPKDFVIEFDSPEDNGPLFNRKLAKMFDDLKK